MTYRTRGSSRARKRLGQRLSGREDTLARQRATGPVPGGETAVRGILHAQPMTDDEEQVVRDRDEQWEQASPAQRDHSRDHRYTAEDNAQADAAYAALTRR